MIVETLPILAAGLFTPISSGLSSTSMRACCDKKKVSIDSRGDDERPRGENETVVAMTGP
jgi:signal recognition particle receptor subunit beta